MNYPIDIAIWNRGPYNAWNTARPPELGMSYFTRTDLNFYYSLADAFTICDQYHSSTFTQTNPNRSAPVQRQQRFVGRTVADARQRNAGL